MATTQKTTKMKHFFKNISFIFNPWCEIKVLRETLDKLIELNTDLQTAVSLLKDLTEKQQHDIYVLEEFIEDLRLELLLQEERANDEINLLNRKIPEPYTPDGEFDDEFDDEDFI